MLFTVYCVDKPGATELRKATREAHLAYLADFDVVFGGPLLTDDGDAMIGTLVVAEFADRAAAETFAANDPYALAGLFERVEIRALRKVAG